jgi:hypothetical protein
LFRGIGGAVPPIVTVGVYQATFLYSGKVDYFGSIGGVDLAFVCLITTLLFVSRVNRAATYPLLARMERRAELLGALVVSALSVTAMMGVLFTLIIVAQGKVTLSAGDLALVLPRWLALFVFSSALGLNMGRLVSRGGSYLITTAAVALLATVSEQKVFLIEGQQNWLVNAIAALASPVTTTITVPVGNVSVDQYLLPVALTAAYALGLFAMAAALFHSKDLVWSE